MNDLVKRSVPRRRWAQGNGRDLVGAGVELVHGHAMTLGNHLQLLAHELHVELGGLMQNRIRVDLDGHRRQHPFLVFIKQVLREALGRGVLLSLGADGVPADLHRHPFLGPVAAEPGDEVLFSLLVDPRAPMLHGATREDFGLLGGRAGSRHNLSIHLLPGGLRHDDRGLSDRRALRRGASATTNSTATISERRFKVAAS